MTINTQKLRDLLNRATERPWVVYTDPDKRQQREAVTVGWFAEYAVQVAVDTPGVPGGNYQGVEFGDPSVDAELTVAAINALSELLDTIDAQAAEIARLREAQAWKPIETAPTDGSMVVLRSRSGRIADGYWLQAAFNGCGAWIWPYVHSEPAHWVPLPAAPGALSGESNG